MNSILDFGAVADGISDCLSAFNKAFCETDKLYIPAGDIISGQTL